MKIILVFSTVPYMTELKTDARLLKCDTNIGCSYYNFGVLCDEELKFKNNIMETFYSKIDRRLKELKEKKELVEKSNFLNINKSVELRILDRCINELNDLLNDKS